MKTGFDNEQEPILIRKPGNLSTFSQQLSMSKSTEELDWGFDDPLSEEEEQAKPAKPVHHEGADVSINRDDDDDWGFGSSEDEDETARAPAIRSESDNEGYGMTASFMDGSSSIHPGQSGWGDLSASFMAGPARPYSPSNSGSETVEWIHETPLGEAVASLDATLVRELLAEGHDAREVDEHYNGLLHAIANPRFSDAVVAYHFDSWSELLQVTRDIVNMLVTSGARLDRQNGSGCPPLLVTVANTRCQWINETSNLVHYQLTKSSKTIYWSQGHVIIALLEAGSDPSPSKLTRGWQHYSILDAWLQTLPQNMRFPESWDLVLSTIMAKMPDVNAIVGEEPPIHKIMRSGMEPDRLRTVLGRLMDPANRRPYRIDSVDVKGNTALLALIMERTKYGGPDDSLDEDGSTDTDKDDEESEKFSTQTIELAKALVRAGARSDYISAGGETALTMAYSAKWEWDVKEEDIAYNMLQLIKISSGIENHSLPRRSRIVDVTPIWVLVDAIHRGRTKIASVLLRYGMKDRLHEVDPRSYTVTAEVPNTGTIGTMTFDLSHVSLKSASTGRLSLSRSHWCPRSTLSKFAFGRVGKTGAYVREKQCYTSEMEKRKSESLVQDEHPDSAGPEPLWLAKLRELKCISEDHETFTPRRTVFDIMWDEEEKHTRFPQFLSASRSVKVDAMRRDLRSKIERGPVEASDSFRPFWRRSYSFAGFERERLKPKVDFASKLVDADGERPRPRWRRDSLWDKDGGFTKELALKTCDKM